MALAYAVGLTVVLNRLFLPQPADPPKPLPKSLFVPDAFTNPAHVRFALKVTLAAMFCYLLYTGLDWFGIHTAFITCVFIALETTGATLQNIPCSLLMPVTAFMYSIEASAQSATAQAMNDQEITPGGDELARPGEFLDDRAKVGLRGQDRGKAKTLPHGKKR